MSMLSAQIDKLRKAAQTYRTLGGHEMEHTLLDAADTINGLRTRCQDLQAENARLRELVRAMEPFLCCMPFASCDTLAANVRKRIRDLGIEVDE